MPTSKASAWGGPKRIAFGVLRVPFAMGKSALKKSQTSMRSSFNFLNFRELQNAQHNGWPCARFGRRTRFRPLTAILRAPSRSGVRGNLTNARRLGVRGGLMRLYISGISPVKSEHTETHQFLPAEKRALLKKLLSVAESQLPSNRRHNGRRSCLSPKFCPRLTPHITLANIGAHHNNVGIR